MSWRRLLLLFLLHLHRQPRGTGRGCRALARLGFIFLPPLNRSVIFFLFTLLHSRIVNRDGRGRSALYSWTSDETML